MRSYGGEFPFRECRLLSVDAKTRVCLFWCDACWEEGVDAPFRAQLEPFADRAAEILGSGATRLERVGNTQAAAELRSKLLSLKIQRGELDPRSG